MARKKNIKQEDLLQGLPGVETTVPRFTPAIVPIPKASDKVGKYKKSGHLADQQLRYDYPKDMTKGQLSIFDVLTENTISEIHRDGIEVSEVVEGIKLSPSQTKVIDSLCKLLHDNSQTENINSSDYYTGNSDFNLVPYGDDKATPAPKLAFTLYELTKEYKGGEAVSGKDVENVKDILNELDSKKFLLSYIEKVPKTDGGFFQRKIEDYRKLISILKISQTEYSKGNVEISKQEETVIMLNPIFRRQIDSKFILYPNDINKRTAIAYGSHNVSDAAIRLRDELMVKHASKIFKYEIGIDRLYYKLCEKWMKEGRRKKVKVYTDRAIDMVQKLGLLIDYTTDTNTKGEPKIIFNINKDWLK